MMTGEEKRAEVVWTYCMSRQGKNGGTFAYPDIDCEFSMGSYPA